MKFLYEVIFVNKKTIEDIAVKGKRVLVRCDFNVPLDGTTITDETRINGALPTIKYLMDNGAKVILCSHMGKPKGEPKPEFSLAPVAASLTAKLGKEVVFAADDNVVGENAKKAVAEMNDGDVVLLQKKQKMLKHSAKNLLLWQTSLLTMLLVQLTEHTVQQLVLQIILILQLQVT